METIYKITIHKKLASTLVCLIGMIFTTILGIVETSSYGIKIIYDLMQLVGSILALYFLWLLHTSKDQDVEIFKIKQIKRSAD